MSATAIQNRLTGAFINTHPAQCSIFESGVMVAGCLSGSPLYELHCLTLADIDLEALRHSGRLVSKLGSMPREFPAHIDFWVFNWHFITMAGHIDPATISALSGLKFTVVLELADLDPLVHVPKNTFDGYLALDPLVPEKDGVFAFPRPLQGTAMQGVVHGRSTPVIGSFGFGTPGKGFELLTEAVNREFERAVLRINVPIGDYISSLPGQSRDYAGHMAAKCRLIAKPGIDVQFSHDFLSSEAVIDWCHDNDLNCFMYTRDQPGLSATTDQAILSGQPLLTLTNATFRHIHPYIAPYPLTTLRAAIEGTRPAVAAMQRDWSKAHFRARFESMLAKLHAVLPNPGAIAPVGASGDIAGTRKRIRVLVLHRPDGTSGDVLSYGTRFVNAITRPATRQIRKAVCNTIAAAVAAIIDERPDVVIAVDYTDEWIAQLAGWWTPQTRPFRLLNGAAGRSGVAMDAGAPPIIPFYTNSIPSPATSVAWLIGFDADDGSLYRWFARIASETRIGRIVVEAAPSEKAMLAADVARYGPLRRSDRSVVVVEVHTLPERADDILIQHLGAESVLIFHAGFDTERTEALCSLALSTERAVIFDPVAPLPSFGSALCLDDRQSLQERIDQGIAGQIAVVRDHGEWALTAHWLPRIDGSDDDAWELPGSDLGAAISLSGLDRLDDEDFVCGLHRALVGRDVEDDKLENHLDALWDGRTKSDLAASIGHSAEALAHLAGPGAQGAMALPADFLQTYLHAWLARLGPLDNNEFVRAAYWAGLGRAADEEGLVGHRTLIESGEVRLYVLHVIVASVEARLHAGQRVAGMPTRPGSDEEWGIVGAAWIRQLSELDPDSFRQVACQFFLGRPPQPGELGAEATASARQRCIAIEALRSSPEGAEWLAASSARPGAKQLSALLEYAAEPLSERPQRKTAVAAARQSFLGNAPTPNDLPLAALRSERSGPAVWILAGTDEMSVPGITRRLLAMTPWGSVPTIGLSWNRAARKLELMSSESSAGGRFLSRENCRIDDWLVIPGGFGTRADELAEVDVLMTARALGLRCACVFVGAEALESEGAANSPAALACERHMQALLLADLILPISNRAHDEIVDLFVEHQRAREAPTIVKLSLPLGCAAGEAAGWNAYASKLQALLLQISCEHASVRSIFYLDRRFDAGDSGRSPLRALFQDRGVAVTELILEGGLIASANPPTVAQSSVAAPSWLLIDGEFPPSSVPAVRALAAEKRVRIVALSPATGPAFDFRPYFVFDRLLVASAAEHRVLQAQMLQTRQRLADAERRFGMIEQSSVAAKQPRPKISAGYRRSPCRFAVIAAASGDVRLVATLDALDGVAARARRVIEVVGHAASGSTAAKRVGIDVAGPGWTWAATVDAALRHSDAAFVLGDAEFTTHIADIAGWVGIPAVVSVGIGVPTTPGVVAVDLDSDDDIQTVALRLLLDDVWRTALRTEALLRCPRTDEDHADDVLRFIAGAQVFPQLSAVQQSGRRSVYARLPALRRRPLLSICISTYNRAGWLGVNLKNLFEQLGPTPNNDVEVVVVDNAATDATPQVVEPYLGRPDFRYYRNPENVGMLGNLVVTAQRSKGSYVWIVGDDDLTLPDTVASILAVLKNHPTLAMVYLNYGYTSIDNPSSIVDLADHLSKFNILEPEGPDCLSTVAGIAANSENFFTAIYACVFERSHALRAFCLDTSGRPFSTMLTCIPTAYYALHHMGELPAYWIGKPSLVVNSNVSWAPYGPLFDLEQLPRAWDLAELAGTPATAVDARRSNRLWLVEMMWRDIFENDVANNAPYLSAARVLNRLKHLPAIDERIGELITIYRRAHAKGHPAAAIAPEVLFSAWPDIESSTT